MEILHKLIFVITFITWHFQGSFCSTIRMDEDEGYEGSPNFWTDQSSYSPGTIQKYIINAGEGKTIMLKFLSFHTEGLDENEMRTDFLRVTADGQKTFLYGNLPTPFYLVFNSRTVRLRFVSNRNNVTYKGFGIFYKIVPTQNSCSRNRNFFMECTNMQISSNVKCISGCLQNNRQLVEDDYATTCARNRQTNMPLTCVDVEEVRRCENTLFSSCIYSITEISKFYDNGLQLEIDPISDQAQREEEKNAIDNLALAASIGRTSIGCRLFCRSSRPRVYIPRFCGFFKHSRSRKKCLKCRYGGRCQSGYFN